jgi:SAM-dependent methyltransferase
MQNGEADLQTLLQRLRNEVRKRKLGFEASEPQETQPFTGANSPPRDAQATETSGLVSKIREKTRFKDTRRALDRAAAKNESAQRWPRFLRGIRRNQETVNDSLISSVKALLQSLESLNTNFSLVETQLAEQTDRNRDQLAQLEQRFADWLRQANEERERRQTHDKKVMEGLGRAAELTSRLTAQQGRLAGFESEISNLAGFQEQHSRQLVEIQRFITEQQRQTVEEQRQLEELHRQLTELRGNVQEDRGKTPTQAEINFVRDKVNILQGSFAVLQEHLLKNAKRSLSKPGARSLQKDLRAHETDAFYLAFENQFRGDREQIKDRFRFYIPIILEAKNTTGTATAIDVGCGRGEWLELLREHGFDGSGVDLNVCMIEECRSRGLQVECADAIAYLRGIPAASLSIVTGFHIVEHLTLDQLLDLFRESFRVLHARGKAIFETPNPECSKVASYSFFLDPTHRNPIPHELLCFAAQHAGFGASHIERLQPYFEDSVLKGYLDYSGIFTK